MLFRIPLFLAILSAFSTVANAAPESQLVVSSGANSGTGTLRAALLAANTRSGARISFRIPRTDPSFDAATTRYTLQILAPLPTLARRDTHIEGAAEIELSGQQLPATAPIFLVQARDCQVSGIRFQHFITAISLSKGARNCRVERCEFLNGEIGFEMNGQTQRGSVVRFNTFESVFIPIQLANGARLFVAAPRLQIERRDHSNNISHTFTVEFKGRPNQLVTLDIGYSPDEARDKPQVRAWKFQRQIKTDAAGRADWTFELPGYPVGSWTALATTKEGTSELSNTVVMPYL